MKSTFILGWFLEDLTDNWTDWLQDNDLEKIFCIILVLHWTHYSVWKIIIYLSVLSDVRWINFLFSDWSTALNPFFWLVDFEFRTSQNLTCLSQTENVPWTWTLRLEFWERLDTMWSVFPRIQFEDKCKFF